MPSSHTQQAPYRYIKLADEIESKILYGTYKAGERLPSIRKLHSQTGFSITTVYQAYVELEKRGRVEARLKSGYFVRSMPLRILPGPAVKPHRPVPKKVSLNTLAGAIVEAMGDPSILQLGGTLTAPELLPCRDLSKCIKSIPVEKMSTLLTIYENPAGSIDLRRQISRRTLDLFQETQADDIVITSGCIESVSLCLQAVAGPGDTIVVESPTYPWFLQIIEDLNMMALEVPTDPETGIDLATLKKTVGDNRVKACLLIPNFHNPLGYVMPEENKRDLVSFLNRKRIPVIEDDIHGDLYFGEKRPVTLKSFDRKGLVLYCSSFSKTLAPGLRIGWAMPGAFLDAVRQLKLNLSIGSPALNQYALAEYLKTGHYDRHLRKLRHAMKNQASNIAMAVARYFPEDTRLTSPKGGVTLWVQMDPAVDGFRVFHEARDKGIAILPGFMCSSTRKYNHFIRISCGFPWSDRLEQGIRMLGKIVADLKARGASSCS